MVVSGVRISKEESHVGWRKRIREEKQWRVSSPEVFAEYVVDLEQTILRRARKSCLGERFDLSLGEVQGELRAWDRSPALPHDWIPRAALRCKLIPLEVLVWCCLCRAWRLLGRPRQWGVAKQVVLHRKGDLFLFTSWRNILVNAEFGLLLERLFSNE